MKGMATTTAKVTGGITFVLTHRCNQKCEFCYDASQVINETTKSDISFETVEKITNFLAKSFEDTSSFKITLSGGEPTLHPSFLEIVEQISNAGFLINILSNGQTFADKDFMEKVLKYNVSGLQLSIEGATAEVHDYRVGCKGAWEHVMHAIKNAQEFGFVGLSTNSTLTNTSIKEMFDIIDLLDTLGLKQMSINNAMPEFAGRNYSVGMSYPKVVEIAEQLTLYALTKRVSFAFITPLPFCLKEKRIINNPSICSAGQLETTTIDNNGVLRPCSVCNPPNELLPLIDSIPSYQAIGEHLNPIIKNYLNKNIPTECLNCSKLRECKAACPLYWKVPDIATPSEWGINLPYQSK